MPEPAADDVSDAGNDPDSHAPEHALVALVDETTDGREYTICPAKATADDIVTRWLTVDETAILDRDDWR